MPIGTVSSKSVLFVDDMDMVRNLVASGLTEEGFDVTLAGNGSEAWNLLSNGLQVAILVTDLAMPELDGVSLLEMVNRQFPGTKLAILSGATLSQDHAERIGRLPIRFYMKKPFMTELLAHRIEQALTEAG